MAKSLIIVESPAKARTISKYLGRGYQVLASVGHVKDLPKSKLGVDLDHDFDPQYVVVANRTSEHRQNVVSLAATGYCHKVLIEKPLFDQDCWLKQERKHQFLHRQWLQLNQRRSYRNSVRPHRLYHYQKRHHLKT